MTTTELVTLAVGVALIIAGAAVTAVGIALNLNLIP